MFYSDCTKGGTDTLNERAVMIGCLLAETMRQKSRGKSQRTWAEGVRHDLQSLGLETE